MSDKQNFSIDASLLSTVQSGSISGRITQALKTAHDYTDDFIRFIREESARENSCYPQPTQSDILSGGKLRYNLIADFSNIKMFFSKGAAASIKGSQLTVSDYTFELDVKARLQWHEERNDFNSDTRCICLSRKAVNRNG